MISVTHSHRLHPGPRPSLVCWTRFFFLAGIIALGYVAFTLIDTERYQTKANARFEEALNGPGAAVPDVPAPGATAPSVVTPGIATPRVTGSAAPLGRIRISSIGVEAMILDGTDDKTLRRAVGHVPGTAVPGQPGNIALAGHRDTFFRELRKIRKNDEITLDTLGGSYRYRVDLIQIVSAEDTESLKSSNEPILTLVTCYPFSFIGPAPQRFVVRAHRIP
jgi:sortase A